MNHSLAWREGDTETPESGVIVTHLTKASAVAMPTTANISIKQICVYITLNNDNEFSLMGYIPNICKTSGLSL